MHPDRTRRAPIVPASLQAAYEPIEHKLTMSIVSVVLAGSMGSKFVGGQSRGVWAPIDNGGRESGGDHPNAGKTVPRSLYPLRVKKTIQIQVTRLKP